MPALRTRVFADRKDVITIEVDEVFSLGATGGAQFDKAYHCTVEGAEVLVEKLNQAIDRAKSGRYAMAESPIRRRPRRVPL